MGLTAEQGHGTTYPVSVTMSPLPAKTKSVEIDVFNSGGRTAGAAQGPFIVNLTLTAPACVRAAGGFKCTTPVAIPYGKFEFEVTAFPAKDVGGNALARGKTTATVTAAKKPVVVQLGAP